MPTKRFIKKESETIQDLKKRVTNFAIKLNGELIDIAPSNDGLLAINVTYSKVPALNGVESVTVLNTNRINKNYEFIQR